MNITKSITLVLISLLLNPRVNGQIQTKMFESYGDAHNDFSNALCIDKEENVYIAGCFSDTINVGEKEITSRGGFDIFLAKYNKNGELKWIKTQGSYYNEDNFITDRATGLCVDKDGYIYMTGTYAGEAVFENTLIRSNKHTNIFIAKYHPSGDMIWVKGYGGYSADHVNQIIYSKDGNIIITGEANRKSSLLPSVEKYRSSGFVAKINSENGEVLWTRNFGYSTTGRTIVSDRKGNIYVGVTYSRPVTINGKLVKPAGEWDFMILKYTSQGELLWYKRIGGKARDAVSYCILDKEDNLYVSGFFQSEVDFGKHHLSSKGKTDAFVCKFASDGSIVWARSFGEKGFDKANCMDFTGEGELIVSGTFEKNISVGNDTLNSFGDFDNFLYSLNEYGDIIAYQQFGGSAYEDIRALQLAKNDEIFLTGTFTGGFLTKDKVYITSGNRDFYLAKVDYNVMKRRGVSGLTQISNDKFKIITSPNPTNGIFSILLVNASGEIEISIYDPEGKKVIEKTSDLLQYHFDFSELSKGIYVVKVVNKGDVYTEKIVFQ